MNPPPGEGRVGVSGLLPLVTPPGRLHEATESDLDGVAGVLVPLFKWAVVDAPPRDVPPLMTVVRPGPAAEAVLGVLGSSPLVMVKTVAFGLSALRTGRPPNFPPRAAVFGPS